MSDPSNDQVVKFMCNPLNEQLQNRYVATQPIFKF